MTSHIFSKYIIVSAGPGGLQMGYFLQRAGRDYLILEKSTTAGAFFPKQPIHRKLPSINKKHNLFGEDEFNWRHDWNSLLSNDPAMRFTSYSDELFPHADDLHRYSQDYATLGVDVSLGEPTGYGPYRPWSAEEMAHLTSSREMDALPRQCNRPS
jgi:cation diffusion facilitator CzcD-associated flavoprotein CzcO